jgi:hypothetical protein
MHHRAREALALAKQIQNSAPISFVPPSEGTKPLNQHVLPHALVSGTRGYIERVVFQINGCYEKGWFDGCAVMMRRLVETLILETFETHGIASKVQSPSTGEFLSLKDLIRKTLDEPSWNLGRNAKQGLPRLKDIGDQSAHSRRFNAHREDIDKVLSDFRTVCQELIYLARLR